MKKEYFPKIAKGLLWLSVAISGYLAAASLLSESIAGCGSGSTCDSVIRGPWGNLFGVPAALLGLIAYLVGNLLADEYAGGTARERWHIFLAQVTYGAIVMAAIWYIGLQLLVLKSICPWCMATHLSALAAIALLVLSRRSQHEAGVSQEDAQSTQAAATALTNPKIRPALLGTALLATAAALTQGPRLIQRASLVANVSEGGLISESGKGELSLMNGQFNFPSAKLKHYGDANSRNVAVALVDYTCPHCRSYHSVLKEVALVGLVHLLPTSHTPQGEEIHKLMLTGLWMDEKKHDEIAEAIFSGKLAAETTAVHARLSETFGLDTFKTNYEKGKQLAEDLTRKAREVLAANQQRVKSDRLPQLLHNDRVLVGYYDNASQVLEFLKGSSQAPVASPQAPLPPPTSAAADVLATNTLKAAVEGAKNPAAHVSANGAALPPALLAERKVQLGLQTTGSEVPVQVILRNPRPLDYRIGWFQLEEGLSLQGNLSLDVPAMVSGGVPLLVRVPKEVGPFQRTVKVMSPEGAEVATVEIHGQAAASTASAN